MPGISSSGRDWMPTSWPRPSTGSSERLHPPPSPLAEVLLQSVAAPKAGQEGQEEASPWRWCCVAPIVGLLVSSASSLSVPYAVHWCSVLACIASPRSQRIDRLRCAHFSNTATTVLETFLRAVSITITALMLILVLIFAYIVVKA